MQLNVPALLQSIRDASSLAVQDIPRVQEKWCHHAIPSYAAMESASGGATAAAR